MYISVRIFSVISHIFRVIINDTILCVIPTFVLFCTLQLHQTTFLDHIMGRSRQEAPMPQCTLQLLMMAIMKPILVLRTSLPPSLPSILEVAVCLQDLITRPLSSLQIMKVFKYSNYVCYGIVALIKCDLSI